MKNTFASKMSYFILTFIFLIIIASFLFSNFSSFSDVGTSKNVATVDGTPITYKEYQVTLSRQLEFYSQMFGGQTLTQKQMEQMGIKQNALNGLIQQKLIGNLASAMGLAVSLEEIKNEIKNLPYFKRNNQFDVNMYRNVLQGNGYTPTQFEELISSDLKQKKVDELFSTTLVSENLAKDIIKFKSKGVEVSAIKVGRQALAPLVTVSEQEINDYVAKAENKKNLEDAYKDNFSKYNKPAEIKARHILIRGDEAKAEEKIKALHAKVTAKNFKDIASKETQDDSGKSNGGDLGWFAKGRMVPEFEDVAFSLKPGQISNPIKTQFGWHIILVEGKKEGETKSLESVKKELAQLAIQKTKASDLDKLMKSQEESLTKLFKENNLASVEAFNKKIDGQFFKSAKINQYDQTLEGMSLAPQEAEQLFKAEVGSVLNLGNAGTIYLVKINSKLTDESSKEEQVKTEVTNQEQLLSRKTREELVKTLNNKAKIVTNAGLM
jgi:peptidyl-prolyl cis-trans isomerase D